MIRSSVADKKIMQPQRLKLLVQAGDYRPDPALIADAMLRRRGVRELLSDDVVQLRRADRSRQAQATGPRAA